MKNRVETALPRGALLGLAVTSAALCYVAQAAAQPPAADTTMLRQILDARASGFATLKGVALAPINGEQVWSATLRPFGLACSVRTGGALTAYFCTNAAAQMAAEANRNVAADAAVGLLSGGLAGGDEAPKTGLSDDAARQMIQSISEAFTVSEQDLTLFAGSSAASEDQETLVGKAAGQYVATIDLISLTEDGDENDDTVNVTVYAPVLTRDPMQE